MYSIVRCSKGSSAIEFAILAPVMLLMLFGMVRVGYTLGVQHSLTQIAADAARYAMPAGSARDRVRLVAEHVEGRSGDYALVRPSRLAHEVVERDGAMTVIVRYDVSDFPDIPIVSAVYAFPDVQSATSVASVVP